MQQPGYLATDNGVYLLAAAAEPLLARRISLPGVGRMCMAITYYADAMDGFLWVSDSAGDAHLFWDQHGTKWGGRSHWLDPNWRRSGIRHDDSQVMLGYASWRTLDGSFVVGQARRNDYVVISRYKAQLPNEAQSPALEEKLSLRDLLRHGTVAHLIQRLPPEERGNDECDPDALLAELFEELGESQEELKVLWEFLGNPNAELACNILRNLTAEEPDRSGRAVELWNHALLGTIHRHGQDDGESLYLGIVRWLRCIAETFPKDTEQAECVQRAVEQQIMFARKWGVFGNSYTRRRSALKPLQVLAAQHQQARDLDHFGYRSLLFQRQVDLEHEDDRGRRAGRTAWDLRTLRVGNRLFLVVSWIWGSIELYEAVAGSRAEGEGYQLDLWAVLEPPEPELVGGADEADEIRLRARNLPPGSFSLERKARDYGFSRAIVLGRCPEGGCHYLLTASAQRPEAGDKHTLELWRLDLEGTRARVLQEGETEVRCPLRCHEADKESVYSLLELEPGWVLAGLRGHGGIAQVSLVVVNGAGTELRCVVPKETLASADPEGKAIARNRVWSLARDCAIAGKKHEVFAGCGDGRVWRLEVPFRDTEIKDDFEMNPTLVERLGAPVWALACRTNRDGDSPVRRIFAGGADGTIAAWQQLQGPAEDSPPKFTTVWATWEEGGPISRIHCLQHNFQGTTGNTPMVLALTQQGRGILFADRGTVEKTSSNEKKHRRLRVPGERYARFELRASVFASELLELPKELPLGNPEGAFARLATATNDGRLQIHTLHHPRYLQVRKEEYERLVKMWLGMVCEPSEKNAFGPFRLERLRMAEAAYVASPVAPQVLVRVMLERDESEHWTKAPQFQERDRQWLPRHLRPLLDLDLAWGRSGNLDARAAGRSLELALERVFRMRDSSLFVEIVTVVLNRANRWLFELTGREDGADPSSVEVRDFYSAVLDALERSLQHWLGSPEKAEIRIRISFAKQLTDGDTLWRLCNWIEASVDIGAILERRIGTIRKLLVLGDPLLALETLRATNLSLIRFCKRLVEDGGRERDWMPGASRAGLPRQEAPWKGLKTYVEALSDYAARASHSSEGISDSLAHEIARSFALTVCACPSAAIRVALWMSEAGLISHDNPQKDRAAAVIDQFKLLGLLNVPVPKEAVELFRRATSSRREDNLDLADTSWQNLLGCNLNMVPSRRIAKIKEKVGEDNGDVIRQMGLYYFLLNWLSELAGQFSGDASGINWWRVRSLLRLLEWRNSEDPFRHSREFWTERMKALWETSLKNVPLKKRRSDRVQPEVVLLSREIERWCQTSLEYLNDRAEKHQIFEPQYSIYRTALSQLRRAADEFPYSTAIQKNIVVGVLGHGLLESLDEHVLELEEIAQALDPLLVWTYRKEGRSLPEEKGQVVSRAEHFTTYLLKRSQDAESIPKNLRTLQGLLNPGGKSDIEEGYRPRFCQDLLRDFWPDSFEGGRGRPRPRPSDPGWMLSEEDEGGDIEIDRLELRYLLLTLKELDQNDRNHGPTYRDRADQFWPRVTLLPGHSPGEAARVVLRFALRDDLTSDDRTRLESLKGGNGLQALILRREAKDVVSHGTGLYLANLSAAVVGWRLSIKDLKFDEYWFSFLLERVHGINLSRRDDEHRTL